MRHYGFREKGKVQGVTDNIQEVDAKALYQIIREKNDLDFLCFAITPWHAIGIDAALFDLGKRLKRKPSGIIVINSHRLQGFLISESSFISKEFADVTFLRALDSNLDISRFFAPNHALTGLFSWTISNLIHKIMLIFIKANRRSINIISPRYPNILSAIIFGAQDVRKLYKAYYIVVDEGLGSYFRPLRGWILEKTHEYKKTNHPSMFWRLKFVLHLMNAFLFKVIFHLFKCEKMIFFRNTGDLRRGVPDQRVVDLYKKIIYKRTFLPESKDTPTENKKQDALILLTQPMSEAGLIREDYEKEILGKVLNVLKSSGIKLILKPHPRENKKKYSSCLNSGPYSGWLELTDTDFSIEQYLALEEKNLNVLAIIGWNSTALITVRILFQIRTISLLKIFPGLLGGNKFRWFFPSFEDVTQNIIMYPGNWGELESVIENIKTGTAICE